MALTPKELALKVQKLKENDKKQNLEIRNEKNRQIKINQLIDQTFYKEIAIPSLESALAGESKHIFINKKLDIFTKNQILNGGFELSFIGEKSVSEIKKDYKFIHEKIEIDENFGIAFEKKINNIIDSIFNLISETELEENFLNASETFFFNDLIPYSLELTKFTNNGDKLKYLKKILSIINTYENITFSPAGKTLTRIVFKKDILNSILKSKVEFEEKFDLISISWNLENKKNSKNLRYCFFSSKVYEWIFLFGKDILNSIFEMIQDQMYIEKKNLELLITEYSKSESANDLVEEGLYLDNTIIEISIPQLIGLIECFGYKVKHKVEKTKNLNNHISNHILNISWKIK